MPGFDPAVDFPHVHGMRGSKLFKVSNTQGGVVHDAKQRVLNSYGEAIPRLYEAGELGSIWSHLYLVGGNIAECFVSGRIAAREVAAISAWDSAGEANRSEAAE